MCTHEAQMYERSSGTIRNFFSNVPDVLLKSLSALCVPKVSLTFFPTLTCELRGVKQILRREFVFYYSFPNVLGDWNQLEKIMKSYKSLD